MKKEKLVSIILCVATIAMMFFCDFELRSTGFGG